MAFSQFPGPNMKRQLRDVNACCRDHLVRWDCGCSWGCSVCWVTYQCTVCGHNYSRKVAEQIVVAKGGSDGKYKPSA